MCPYRWKLVTLNAAFAPRDGAGALTFQDRMWLIGGWNPDDKVNFPRVCTNDVWCSRDGAEWQLKKPNTFLDGPFDPALDWAGRHTAGYAVFRDRLWIVGGDVIQGNYQNDVWVSEDGLAWRRVTADAPWGPRVLHYTFVLNDRLYILGGQTLPQFADAPERFYRDVWSTDDGVTWIKAEGPEPGWAVRGMIGGSAVHGGFVWLLGGGIYDTPDHPDRTFYNDVWRSPDGVHWECVAEQTPWAPRQYHEVAVFDGHLWVMEGYYNANRNDVWYSTDGAIWHEIPDTPWKPRHAASIFVFDDALWMVTGNNMESDVWKLERV